MKNGLQNGAKIDAKIIQCRFWAAKGAPTVDLECFLGGFEKLYNFQSSLDAQKGSKIDRCGTRGGEGGRQGMEKRKSAESPGNPREPPGPAGEPPPPPPTPQSWELELTPPSRAKLS